MIDKSRSRLSTTRRFLFCTKQLFSLLSNPYISNISNIYNPDKNSSLASQTICDHMFSDPKSDHTFYSFFNILGLYVVSYRMWKFSTYFEYGKVLESTVSWFLVEFNIIQLEYYFSPTYNQILYYILGYLFQR